MKMKLILNVCVFIFVLNCVTATESSSNGIGRNLYQFYNMITAVTGFNPLTTFNGYGCWCGLGGFGKPIDEIDSCCLVHDQCYSDVERQGCSPKLFNIYSYTAKRGYVECKDAQGTCNYKICTCDKNVADCYYKNLNKYKSANRFTSSQKLQQCKCSAGKYIASPLSTACTDCAYGFYNDKEGQIGSSACKKCSAGTIANFIKTACITCLPGTYSLSSGRYCMTADCKCNKCPNGYICPNYGTINPTRCPTGTTSDSNNLKCI